MVCSIEILQNQNHFCRAKIVFVLFLACVHSFTRLFIKGAPSSSELQVLRKMDRLECDLQGPSSSFYLALESQHRHGHHLERSETAVTSSTAHARPPWDMLRGLTCPLDLSQGSVHGLACSLWTIITPTLCSSAFVTS